MLFIPVIDIIIIFYGCLKYVYFFVVHIYEVNKYEIDLKGMHFKTNF